LLENFPLTKLVLSKPCMMMSKCLKCCQVQTSESHIPWNTLHGW
jgi:hypothetical protein